MDKGCLFCSNLRIRKRHPHFENIIACEHCIAAQTVPDYCLRDLGLPTGLFSGLPYFTKSTWSKRYGSGTVHLYMREHVDRLIEQETGFPSLRELLSDKSQREEDAREKEQRQRDEERTRTKAADDFLKSKRIRLIPARETDVYKGYVTNGGELSTEFLSAIRACIEKQTISGEEIYEVYHMDIKNAINDSRVSTEEFREMLALMTLKNRKERAWRELTSAFLFRCPPSFEGLANDPAISLERFQQELESCRAVLNLAKSHYQQLHQPCRETVEKYTTWVNAQMANGTPELSTFSIECANLFDELQLFETTRVRKKKKNRQHRSQRRRVYSCDECGADTDDPLVSVHFPGVIICNECEENEESEYYGHKWENM